MYDEEKDALIEELMLLWEELGLISVISETSQNQSA